MNSSVAASQVGRFGYPQCCFAGTFCLLGFSREHCGPHYLVAAYTTILDAVDSGIATAMSAWIRLATCSTAPSIASFPPASPVQHVWDNRCCEVQADLLLDAAADPIERARLLASRAPGSGDWLGALPLSGIGLKMDNATVRIAVGLRLGAPVVRTHKCVCGSLVTVDGHHGLSCRHGSGRHSRHN